MYFLCLKSIGDRWIPTQRSSKAELSLLQWRYLFLTTIGLHFMNIRSLSISVNYFSCGKIIYEGSMNMITSSFSLQWKISRHASRTNAPQLKKIFKHESGQAAVGAREWCLQRTGAVPLRYRHTHRRTDTWWVARRKHVEGTAQARRQYVVWFSACDSVRRRHGGRKRHALPVRWLQNHF